MRANLIRDTVTVPLTELRLDDSNVVTHDDHNRETVRKSVLEYGQYRPMLVDTGVHDESKRGVIRAGNLLFEVLVELGYQQGQVVWMDFESEAMARKLAVLDNRSSELRSWNWEALAGQLHDFVEADLDLGDLGFKDFELEPLMGARFHSIAPDTDPTANDPRTGSKMIVFKVPVGRVGPVREAIEKAKRMGAQDEASALIAVAEAFNAAGIETEEGE